MDVKSSIACTHKDLFLNSQAFCFTFLDFYDCKKVKTMHSISNYLSFVSTFKFVFPNEHSKSTSYQKMDFRVFLTGVLILFFHADIIYKTHA